jgi:putative nucleotidyltransferase with HDIG domain
MSWTTWIRSGEWARPDQAIIPMLPANVRELVQLALDPEITVRQLASTVGKDPVLAAQVIRMANTAGSAPGCDITNIDDAVMRLGTLAVRNVVVAGCLSAQLADPKIYGKRGRAIVDHSIGTAAIAGQLAEKHGAASELFLCGLLHDIGKLLLLKLAHEYGRTHPRPTEEEIESVIVARHAQLGAWLAGQWQMPQALSDPIAWHHDLSWAEDRTHAGIVYAANRLAHRYGFGCEPETADLLADPVMLELGLTEAALLTLDAHAPQRFQEIRHAIGG